MSQPVPGEQETDITDGIRLSDWYYKYKKSSESNVKDLGNDSNLLIVFYVQIMPDDFVMQLH
ncbi:hypothetical protein P2S25_10205, partial [Escherichia coli]